MFRVLFGAFVLVTTWLVIPPTRGPSLSVPPIRPPPSMTRINVVRKLGSVRPPLTEENGGNFTMVESYLGHTAGDEKDFMVLKKYKGLGKTYALQQFELQDYFENHNNKSDDPVMPIHPIRGSFYTNEEVSINDTQYFFQEPCLWTTEDVASVAQTIRSYPMYPQKFYNIPFFSAQNFMKNRRQFIKTTIKESIRMLGILHRNDIVHRTINGNSIVLSTFEDGQHKKLQVCYTNLYNCMQMTSAHKKRFDTLVDIENFAHFSEMIMGLDRFKKKLMRKDYYDLGLTLLEMVYSSLGIQGVNGRTSSDFIQRRLNFKESSVFALRDWTDEDEFSLVLEMLGENDDAGWDLFQKLINTHECEDFEVFNEKILNHPFFNGIE